MTAAPRTVGHTALPMRDAIRLGAGGIHYLAVFDDHTERPLYLGPIWVAKPASPPPISASSATPATAAARVSPNLRNEDGRLAK
jgi:hypothetical protein